MNTERAAGHYSGKLRRICQQEAPGRAAPPPARGGRRGAAERERACGTMIRRVITAMLGSVVDHMALTANDQLDHGAFSDLLSKKAP
jgi:hypothetical protein